MEVPEVKRPKALEEDNSLLAEVVLDTRGAPSGSGAKVLTTAQKQVAVVVMCDAILLSQRRACMLVGLCQHVAMRCSIWQLMLMYQHA